MPKHRSYRWMRVPIAILLLATMLPVAATVKPPAPAAAQSSDSPCTGDIAADYNSECGPSLTIPDWSDGKGWKDDVWFSNDPVTGGVPYKSSSRTPSQVTLFDLNGDGQTELIGVGPHGLEVYKFSNDLGQWVAAYDRTKPLPLPHPKENLQWGPFFGQLADGVWGAAALVINPDTGAHSLETWSWNPGDGSIESGVWTLENQNGPFSDSSCESGNWCAYGYGSTIQFVPGQLDGVGYSIIGRGANGIERCSWDHASKQWSCASAGDAFNNGVMGSDGVVESYFFDTVQMADIYHETAGPELFGLDNRGDGVLKVYTWDAGSQQFTELQTSGNAPFWSPQGQWYDVKYATTIQSVRLLGKDQPLQVIGRASSGLEWHSLNASGCGGHTPPCWKNLTHVTIFTDGQGFGAGQYYETIRFGDFDGDGIDEVLARNPQGNPAGQIGVWKYHPNAGWYRRDVPTPDLADGQLWSDPTYYSTIQVGDITGYGLMGMVTRGKYGVRTWTIQNGLWRPQPLGFAKFSTAEQHAYDLANAFVGLDPTSGTTIRTQYGANVASTLLNYQDCLTGSLSKPMPPTEVCPTEGGGALPNPNVVTADQWQSMATLLEAELHAAHGLTQYAANSSSLMTDVFFYNESGFHDVMTNLFPSPPEPSHSIWAKLFSLFIDIGEAGSIAAGPEGLAVNAGLHLIAAAVAGMQAMQTPHNNANTRQLKVEEVQSYIYSTTADALSSLTALYQYIAADSGLLALYGAMTDQGFWNLTGERLNAATSAAEYHTATWIYQTFTPVFWQIWACQVSGTDYDYNCKGADSFEPGLNAMSIGEYDGIEWYAFLGDSHYNAISLSGWSGPLFQRVIDVYPDTCIVGGTDANTYWTWDRTDCSLDADIDEMLSYQGGWTTYECFLFPGPDRYPCSTSSSSFIYGIYPPTDSGPPNYPLQ